MSFPESAQHADVEARIAAIPLIVVLFLFLPVGDAAAGLLFAAAGIDSLDGYFAPPGQISRLGAFLTRWPTS